jgi:hypothetical protein
MFVWCGESPAGHFQTVSRTQQLRTEEKGWISSAVCVEWGRRGRAAGVRRAAAAARVPAGRDTRIAAAALPRVHRSACAPFGPRGHRDGGRYARFGAPAPTLPAARPSLLTVPANTRMQADGLGRLVGLCA